MYHRMNESCFAYLCENSEGKTVDILICKKTTPLARVFIIKYKSTGFVSRHGAKIMWTQTVTQFLWIEVFKK